MSKAKTIIIREVSNTGVKITQSDFGLDLAICTNIKNGFYNSQQVTVEQLILIRNAIHAAVCKIKDNKKNDPM